MDFQEFSIDRFPAKNLFWLVLAFAYLVAIVMGVVLVFGTDKLAGLGISGCFIVLLIMYHLHLRRCGMTLQANFFVFADPTKSKITKIKWADIKGYDFSSVEEWFARSRSRKLLYLAQRSEIGLTYGNDKFLQIYLKSGTYIAIPPIYAHQDVFIDEFKRRLQEARRNSTG